MIRYQKSKLKKVLPLVVFLLFSGMTIIIVNNQIKHQQKLVHRHTITAAEHVSIRLENFMDTRLSALEVLAKRWVQRPEFTRKRFLSFAELYYTNYPGFRSINWVDPKGIIRWVYPEESNRAAIGMDIHNHPKAECQEVFARVERTREYGITPCMELFQGGQGFAVDYPLIYNGKPQGYLNGVFQIKPMIETCLARGVFEDFYLDIYEEGELIYQYLPGDDKTGNGNWYVKKEIQFREKTWHLKIKPKPELYSATTLTVNLPLLFFGLLVSISMGLLVYSLLRETDLCGFVLKERETAEKSLIESEERYRTMIENANDIIWILDTQGNLTFSNHQSEIISGHKFGDWEGKSFASLIHPDDLEMVNGIFQKTLSGEPQHYIVRVLKKNGEIFILSVNTTPIYERDKIVGTASFGRDITARLQAEEELKKSFERLKKTIEDVVHAMALTVELKDPYTAGHQRKVAKLACAIAKEMGLSKKQIEGIRIAAILHDIGKIVTPREILNKPDKLTASETEKIKNHPQIGSNILKTIEFDWPIADIVLQHHERINKSGYPRQLEGKDIMLEGKIIAVADVVQAMCSKRPYRPAHSLEKALEEILQNKGILYEEEVVDACTRLFTKKAFSFD